MSACCVCLIVSFCAGNLKTNAASLSYRHKQLQLEFNRIQAASSVLIIGGGQPALAEFEFEHNSSELVHEGSSDFVAFGVLITGIWNRGAISSPCLVAL